MQRWWLVQSHGGVKSGRGMLDWFDLGLPSTLRLWTWFLFFLFHLSFVDILSKLRLSGYGRFNCNFRINFSNAFIKRSFFGVLKILYLFDRNLIVGGLLHRRLLGVSHLSGWHLGQQLRLVGHLFLAALSWHHFALVLLHGELLFGFELWLPLLSIPTHRDQLVCHYWSSIIIHIGRRFDF